MQQYTTTMRSTMSKKLSGIHEIAELAGVTKQAVCNWSKRSTTFPKPIAQLRMGPIYDHDEIMTWLKKREKGTLHA